MAGWYLISQGNFHVAPVLLTASVLASSIPTERSAQPYEISLPLALRL